MDTKNLRLRAHQRNIDRYEGLLKTQLTDAERKFVERRLSEERFSIATLEHTGPAPS
ncbi:hypothetical protein [Bradyrhizobium iriomotense]|uniref:hypothetical protein n=1 Tax=Bradyrhizobium iriomotense TaxID=441950 RepID=UPI0024E0FDC7|nr:hypothetical protein [Bradyrhizobium iriomotense]